MLVTMHDEERTPHLHTDREFRAELAVLHERLLLMGARVEEMITQSTRAVVERDVDLARQTILTDRKVNEDEIELDRACLRILARRNPVARDLRFVTLVLKMVTDMERIGDLTVNVCERAQDLARLPPDGHSARLEQMGALARAMVHDALDAFVAGDEAKAHAVIARDDEMDELYNRFFDEVLRDMLADTSNVRRGVQLQAAAKYYERICDHGTNLAEHVLFLVRGEDYRHRGKRPSDAPGA